MNACVDDVYVPAESGESLLPRRPSSARIRTVLTAIETQVLHGGRRIRVARASAYREPTIPAATASERREESRRHKVSPELQEVDAALEAWARWARGALAGLGWPPRTMLARMIEFGASGAASRSGGIAVESDSLCEVVERAVLRLGDIERTVICKHYLHWQPVEVSARYAHMTQGRFRTVLHRARRRVADYLDGAKAALRDSQ